MCFLCAKTIILELKDQRQNKNHSEQQTDTNRRKHEGFIAEELLGEQEGGAANQGGVPAHSDRTDQRRKCEVRQEI